MPIEIGSFSVGFVVGGAIVGTINHFLAKSRDIENRTIQQFNEAADDLAKILTDERSSPNPNRNIDFFNFRRVLSKRSLRRFDKCVEKYEKTKNDSPTSYSQESGDVVIIGTHYHDNSPVIAEIDNLLKFTKRK